MRKVQDFKHGAVLLRRLQIFDNDVKVNMFKVNMYVFISVHLCGINNAFLVRQDKFDSCFPIKRRSEPDVDRF